MSFWDIEPKAVKVSQIFDPITIPITLRGEPEGGLSITSLNTGIAKITNGDIRLGPQVGATMVIIRDQGNGIRYIQVEVMALPGQSGDGYSNGDDPTDWGL